MDLDTGIECSGTLTDYENELFADFLSTDTTLANNTDLKQLDIQSKQLGKTLLMQKFYYLPTLSLTGLYQWTSYEQRFQVQRLPLNPYSVIGVS